MHPEVERLLAVLRTRFGKAFYAYVGPRPAQLHLFFREQGLAVHVWTLTARDDLVRLRTDESFLARVGDAVQQGEQRLRRMLAR